MRKNNRGFSMLEVVLAMSITLLISVGAISAMLTSNRITEASDMKYWAASEIANLKECFVNDAFANTADNALAFYFGTENSYRLTKPDGDPNYCYSFYYDSDKKLMSGVNTGYMKIEFHVKADLRSVHACAYRINPNNQSEIQVLYGDQYDMDHSPFIQLRP